MGSSSSGAPSNKEMKQLGAVSGYPPDWMKRAEKTTGDDLKERGVKLSWRSRLRRWWFGWDK